MENVMLLVIGIVAAVIGVVNIRGNISTIHSYNRRNAREEDVPPIRKNGGHGDAAYRRCADFGLSRGILEGGSCALYCNPGPGAGVCLYSLWAN